MANNGRTLGWVLFALRLAANRAGLLAASMVTALVAATLLVIASVLAPSVAEQTFRGTVDTVPSSAHDLRATTAFDTETWDDVDAGVRKVAEQHSGIVQGVSGAALTFAATLDADADVRLALGAFRDIDSHAELLSGRWPESGARPTEVVVHAEALPRLGIDVGDAVVVDLIASGTSVVDARVVGSYAPVDRDHPLWRGMGHGVQQDDSDSPVVVGPVLVTPDDLVSQVQPRATTAAWAVSVDLSAVSNDTSADAVRDVAGLRSELAEVPTGDRTTSISVSGGSDVLERAVVAASSARAVLLVIATMVTVLAAWSLAYTSRTLADARVAATALLRARGGPAPVVAGVSAMSVAGPAILVALAAPPLAEGALRAMREQGFVASLGDPGGSWLISIAAAVGWLVLVVFADIRSGRSVVEVAADSARPSRRSAMQRAGLDVIVLALGGLALQQLRRPAGDVPEIVLIVAPTVLVLAGTLIMIRLLPWCGRAAAWLAARARGVPSMLGSFEVARRPLRHVGPVAMLVLALAAAVFTASTQATWSSFRANAVLLAEPADVTVRFAQVDSAEPGAEMAERSEQLTALPGVEQAMPVFRSAVRQDFGQLDVVGMDLAHASDVMSWPAAVAGAPVGELIEAIRNTRAGALATQPYLDLFGLTVGDRTVIRLQGRRSMDVTVVGSVGAVPAATSPYAIMLDEQILRQALGDGDPQELIPLPTEWWLAATDDGRSAASSAAELPGVIGVSTYAAAAQMSDTDVSYRGLYGGLIGGLVFAIMFGVVGTLLQALALYRARSGEHAVLRAVGLRRWSTVVSVTTEQVLLIGFAGVVGFGLGLAVSWATVPQTVGRLAGLPEVPPLILQTPWPVVAVLGAGTAALLTLIVAVASVGLRRVRITGVLRAGDQR